MFYNYLKIAFRTLWRNRLLSVINITGLSLGMACSLLIWLWVNDELQYNRVYPDPERVYVVRLTDGTHTSEMGPSPLADALKSDVPEVAGATKLSFSSTYLLQAGDRKIKETGYYTSADFFEVFGFPSVQGNAGAALQSPDHIVITRRVAEKLFNSVDVVGKPLRLNNEKEYLVGAVVENVSRHSTVQFDWVVNFKAFEEDWMNNWGNYSFPAYVKLRPNTTRQRAEAAMKSVFTRYAGGDGTIYPILQPIRDSYLYGEYANGQPAGGRIAYVRGFTVTAIFILLIACVNFMNLATARSSLRAKEVGVRKVIGASRSALISQFIGESILISLLAALIAIGLVLSVLPAFNQVFGKELAPDFRNPVFWLVLAGLVGITGLVAGSYPALFLSAMRPVRVLKSTISPKSGVINLRKALVVFQFSLSILLMIGMLVIGQQMNYIRSKHLGLDRENIVYIPLEGELRTKTDAFRQELLRSGAIQSVAATGELPINIGSSSTGQLSWAGKDPDYHATVANMMVGYDFIQTMGVELIEGRDFDPNAVNGPVKYLINESAAKLMNLTDPVGQEIEYKFGKGQITGVMKDFHMRSFYEPIQPLIFLYKPDWTNFLLVRTAPGQTAEALHHLEKTTAAFNPNYPFDYHFLDEAYEKLYQSETVVHTLVNMFGLLAIGISCLGLFGLATFTAERRTKEIGIRKVLGASVGNIVTLLSGDFLRLVFLAFIIAAPLAWYAAGQWLQNFEYQITIGAGTYMAAGLTAVGIALFTVSYQALKAALANPVKSLRSE